MMDAYTEFRNDHYAVGQEIEMKKKISSNSSSALVWTAKMKMIEERLTALLNGQRDLERRFFDAKARSNKEMIQGVSSDKLAQYSRYFEYLTDAMHTQQKKIQQVEDERAKCIQEQIAIKKKVRLYV